MSKADSLDISVQGVQRLSIVTDSLTSKNCDHVDIVLPTLFPKEVQAEAEKN